jgi:hypothetical protein
MKGHPMKLLREKYKTPEGAYKRARFENGIADGEYRRGEKRRIYRYSMIEKDGLYRVAGDTVKIYPVFEDKLAQY